ncbi:hypothetical protein M2160_002968 [Streptomyces sp. SAI-117]|uniref:hypothetical protein n=1 Tax=Streptomyces sp. SAI-117 TaxID=2940546 RepID=UPI0024766469|nr:hypothetical protein [Streptomyces sp. SAI-117]MDH6567947.1 hypothetical protein [Streptomyces sp. SAI-117]
MSDVGLDRPGTPGAWDTGEPEEAGELDTAQVSGAPAQVSGASELAEVSVEAGAAESSEAVVKAGAAESSEVIVQPGVAEPSEVIVEPGVAEASEEAEPEDAGPLTAEAVEDAAPHAPSAPAPRAPEISTGLKPATPGPARRSAADPVKALMHRHRELCERAVDPLEIAAGLEAHGVTDRTAVRFRHRDVFSLAEEMYARVARDGDTPPPATAPSTPRARADWVLLTLLPGALCAATVAGMRLTVGQPRLVAALVGFLAVSLAMRAALSRGPLGTPDRAPANGTSTWTYWLLAYATLGDGLLAAAVTGGPDALPTGAPDAAWPMVTAPVLALTLSCAPAAWSAHLFATRARRKLTVSRGLEDFAASVRPLLLGTFALYLCALTALSALSGAAVGEPAAHPQVIALGALLLLARLLTVHGFTHAPAVVLTAAATAQATALAAAFASRLPGCGFLAAPVDALVDLWGAGGIPTLSCGLGALALLIHGARKLTRASAHARAENPC